MAKAIVDHPIAGGERAMENQQEFKGSDNNGQRIGKVETGEKRNGRLNQFKNAKEPESEYNEQYVSEKEE